MRRFIVHSFAFIGLSVMTLVLLGVILALTYRPSKPSVPDMAVLRLDFSQAFQDVAKSDPFAHLRGEQKAGFLDLLKILATATTDPRVKGLIADVDGVSMSLGQVQELRDALTKFRAAGKFAYAYGESLSGNKDIYLASAFDQIAVQPMGGLGLTGLMAERLFLRGTLDKIGIEPEVERRRDYKTAGDAFLFTGYTSSEREMILSYVGSLSAQMIEGIAKGRGLSADDVRALVDRGPFTTEEALKSRLIDKIAFFDEVRDGALMKASPEGQREGDKPKARLIASGKYAAATEKSAKSDATKIALVPASGAIVNGDEGPNFGGNDNVAASTLAKAINHAIDDKDIKAILLRVNSPGGSATASETIRHALAKARKAGKPVVVSMSGVAASGGYWISMGADAIVAEPATITGSIGVFSLKPNIEKLAADWGANYDRILFGANAGINSNGKPYTPAERERLGAQIDEVYNLFKAGVADGRNMTVESVEKIAQGRVWSGAQAKDLGLVDQLGGLDTAQAILREKLKLGADAPLSLEVFPKPPGFFEMLSKNLGTDQPSSLISQIRAQNPQMARLAHSLDPYLQALGLSFQGQVLVYTTAPYDFN
jgi:protease-4